MMPLTYANPGEENIIKKIGGGEGMRRHLAQLGFVPGATVTVITDMAGNVIVNIKESRIAINRGMANKIMV